MSARKRRTPLTPVEREVLSRVRVPPFSVKVAGPSTSFATGTHYCDGVVSLSFKDGHEMRERLRLLASVAMADGLDGGGEIIIARRRPR